MGFLKKLGSLFTATEAPPANSASTKKPPAAPRQPRPEPAKEAVIYAPLDLADPHCPHCGHKFNPPPKAKKKCPACGNFVHVRQRVDGKRHLVRPDQLAEVDADWEASLPKEEWDEEDDEVMDVVRTAVVGVAYPNDNGSSRQAIIAKCKVGERLTLKHTPVKQDPNGVVVLRRSGEQLGWLSRGVAAEMVEYLDNKQEYRVVCKVIELLPATGDKPMLGCRIKILIDMK